MSSLRNIERVWDIETVRGRLRERESRYGGVTGEGNAD